MPSFKEQIDVAVMAAGVQWLFLAVLMGAGQMVNNEAFEWAHSMPDMSHATSEIGRFINDIAAYKVLHPIALILHPFLNICHRLFHLTFFINNCNK